MYKIIYNDLIIDLIKKPKYLRYLTKSGRTVVTDESSAHCILGSNNKDIYLLQGVTRPEGKDWKEVTIKSISESEYNRLSKAIMSNQSVHADNVELNLVRTEKLKEMSTECHNNIVNGITVLFSDNRYHTFELTIEDQINLMTIENDIKNGANYVLYHEKGKLCQMYSSGDMRLLINAARKHKTYHTTYFNILKNYIYSLYDINIIRSIYYGIELPEEVSDKLYNLLG